MGTQTAVGIAPPCSFDSNRLKEADVYMSSVSIARNEACQSTLRF